MADTMERLQLVLGDRYTFERELGRGGMATVYLAKDLRHDRAVAVKVLNPDLSASIGAERFEREIKVSGRLQHPHILSMYDSGVADGFLFYVMPFVEGESLRDRIDREGQLPVDDALHITLEVADALGYAHKQQVIHRDIKPENILLSGGHALVADFGIARAVEEGSQKLTQTGMALGTPVYMAPEQGMGESVGPTVDIYSLGCVLYEMLAGEPPFAGKNTSAILAKHVMEQVPSIRIVRQSVPEEVEMAIFAALGKSPADRPQTCAEFAEMLVMAPVGSTSTRLMTMRHTAARRSPSGMTNAFPVTAGMNGAMVPLWRRPLVLAATAVVLLAGGFAAWKLAGHKPKLLNVGGLDATHVAVLYFEDRSPGDTLGLVADGLTESLIHRLAQVQGLNVISQGGVEPYRGKTAVRPDSIAKALQTGTVVKGTVDQAGDKIRVSVQVLDGNSGVDLPGSPQSFDAAVGNLALLQDSTAQEVASMIREGIGQQVQLKQQRSGTTNNDAWLQLQRADRLRKDAAATTPDSAAPLLARADSLLANAEQLDPKWPDPIIARAAIAYGESRRSGLDAIKAEVPIERGLGHINRALALDPQNADALELRGNLEYWRWLLGLQPDSTRAVRLLDSARTDLEEATRINPGQAGAWASLSHLYYQLPDKSGVDINIAARNAWQADAFLSNAQTVLERLFLSSYDLEAWPDAKNWCEETQRRFPASYQAPRCRLFLLTSRADSPDVKLAWTLADSVTARAPASRKDFQRLNSDMLVAAVLARAGLMDSARAVEDRSSGNPEIDSANDLAQFAAYVDILRGDTTAAINHLKAFLAASRRRKASLAANPGWWYRPIQETPAFKALVGTGS